MSEVVPKEPVNKDDNQNEGKKKEGDSKTDINLKGLSKEQLEKLFLENPEIKSLIDHNVETKRHANDEAKKYREELDKLKESQAKAEQEKKEKAGEFEKLYQEEKNKNEENGKRIKDLHIQSKLAALAAKNGLVNEDYLKLFPKGQLEVDDDLNISNLDEVFNQFKSANTILFNAANIPGVDNTRPNNEGVNVQKELDSIKSKAIKSADDRDVTRYMAEKAKAGQK